MAGWSASKPECPIDLASRSWIERRWAWLIEQFGLDRVRTSRVILPAPEFFPDSYTQSGDSVQKMLDRVCGYMGIEPATVELSLYADNNPVFAGRWRQGTAGAYQDEEGKYRIWIEANTLKDPLALVATMAHELGHVHLLGHGRISPETDDHEPLTDLLTVYFGMGVCAANAVIREAYSDAGAISTWSMGRQGYLSMDMFGYALARFAHTRSEEAPPWAKHLRPDVRATFAKATRFIAATGLDEIAPAADPVNAQDELPPFGMAVAPDDQHDPSGEAEEFTSEEDEVESPSLSAGALLHRYQCGERDFRGLDLQGLRLCEAFLRECDFTGADLSEADLTRAVLTECDLSEADLQDTVLCGALLRGANLSEVDLSGANLTGADLSGADIRGADFREATLAGCVLTETRRSAATDFTGVDLSQVVCDVDIGQELLQGVMRTDRFNAWVDCVLRYAMCTLFAVLFGALIGMTLGAILLWPFLGDDGIGVGMGGGALLSGIICVRKLGQLPRAATANETHSDSGSH